MMELPKYKCHKTVSAFKIAQIVKLERTSGIQNHLLESGGFIMAEVVSMEVSKDYMKKHKPEVGGYWIGYDDGYESYSPADAFEAGYTKI